MPIVRVEPAKTLRGTLRPPSDKSLTHRALLLGALSDRAVRIRDPLDSGDTAATLGAIQACGVEVEGDLAAELKVTGAGLRGLRPPPMIDCANAGTLMRLLAGILAGGRADRIVLDGDDSLRARPMNRIARPLADMGAGIWTAPGGTPPVVVSGAALRGIEHDMAVASAQVKSCLLLAGLFAHGTTVVREPAASRDHTERMLLAAGVPLEITGLEVAVTGPIDGFALPDVSVPADFSSAAPHLVAAALIPGSAVRITGVNLNPRRTGLLDVLRRMGADVTVTLTGEAAGEPAGDIQVRGGDLAATEVEPSEVPAMIDELPLVGLLGARASGRTAVRGAGELRVKESDRIASVVAALVGIGCGAREREDGFVVTGSPRIPGGRVDAVGDHRLAMLGAVAGLASAEGVAVAGFEAVGVSYPRFAADLALLGAGAA